jgi:hypothetical protein
MLRHPFSIASDRACVGAVPLPSDVTQAPWSLCAISAEQHFGRIDHGALHERYELVRRAAGI